jgi:hypothetical protein
MLAATRNRELRRSAGDPPAICREVAVAETPYVTVSVLLISVGWMLQW